MELFLIGFCLLSILVAGAMADSVGQVVKPVSFAMPSTISHVGALKTFAAAVASNDSIPAGMSLQAA